MFAGKIQILAKVNSLPTPFGAFPLDLKISNHTEIPNELEEYHIQEFFDFSGHE